jgi:hypothetical protein
VQFSLNSVPQLLNSVRQPARFLHVLPHPPRLLLTYVPQLMTPLRLSLTALSLPTRLPHIS